MNKLKMSVYGKTKTEQQQKYQSLKDKMKMGEIIPF